MAIKKYYTGDVASAMGLSIEGVKYYEKLDFIKSKREENGYRYFRYVDVAKLAVLKEYLSYKIDKKATIQLMTIADKNEQIDILNNAKKKMIHEMKMSKIAIRKLEEKMSKIENVQDYLNIYQIIDNKAHYLFVGDDDRDMRNDLKVNTIWKELYSLVPTFDNVHLIKKDIKEDTYCNLGFRIYNNDYKMFDFDIKKFCKYVKKQKYIYTVQELKGDKPPIVFLNNILNFVKENNYEINGYIEISHLCCSGIKRDNYMIQYYEYFIPIK